MSDTATEVQVCSQHDDNDNNQPRFDSVWSETTYSSTSFEWSVNWKLQFLNLPHTFFIIVTSTESVKDTLRSVCNRQKHIKQRPVFKSATPACSSTAKPKAHSNLPPQYPWNHHHHHHEQNYSGCLNHHSLLFQSFQLSLTVFILREHLHSV